jgi:hypothetical protein
LFKTFLTGLVIGIAAAVAALYYVPVVDQQREASIISVATNGGNRESFHINIPMDRIMVGSDARNNPLPIGMEWPQDAVLQGLRTELFKVRNAHDAVIGIASRIAVDDVIEWVVHFPARGSLYVAMQSKPLEGGYRLGELRAGSNEFAELSGRVVERWVKAETSSKDTPTGRIELISSFVGEAEDFPDDGELL